MEFEETEIFEESETVEDELIDIETTEDVETTETTEDIEITEDINSSVSDNEENIIEDPENNIFIDNGNESINFIDYTEQFEALTYQVEYLTDLQEQELVYKNFEISLFCGLFVCFILYKFLKIFF